MDKQSKCTEKKIVHVENTQASVKCNVLKSGGGGFYALPGAQHREKKIAIFGLFAQNPLKKILRHSPPNIPPSPGLRVKNNTPGGILEGG